jgi:4-hydroxy-3-methylbut-2-enyl diphosphate reductase
MKISIAKKAGFCFGVKRAIEIAYETLNNSADKPVYTLGPLVHNPQVIQKLEKDGIKTIEELDEHPVGYLVIRTHGVSPSIRNRAITLGYTIIDATCPLVQKIHDIALDLQNQEYPILVIGHASHPEVIGIVGEVEGNCQVIESVEDAKNLPYRTKLGVVVQTTALWPKYHSIATELLEKAKEVRIYNTICQATIERQTSAEEIAAHNDLMVIIGGKNSSNTRRLLEICLSVNPRAHLVESPDELQNQWFEGVNRVGLTAGASTPDYIINDIYEYIEKFGKS